MKSKKSKYDDDYVEIIIYLYLEMLEGFLNEKIACHSMNRI